MFIAGIAGIPHQQRQLALALHFIAQRVECRVHTRWEVQQLTAYIRVPVCKPGQIATSREDSADSSLRQTPQRVKQAEFQATGDLIQIGAPGMPVKLRALNRPA